MNYIIEIKNSINLFTLCVFISLVPTTSCQHRHEHQHFNYASVIEDVNQEEPELQKKVVEGMVNSAKAFINSLTTDQRKKALVELSDTERKAWDFWPGSYDGVQIDKLSKESQELAKNLLASGLSAQGLSKLEIIHALEKFNPYFSPYYFILIFGEPDEIKAWGWRFQGHHTSFNFTISGGKVISNTPAFLGTQPLSHPSIHQGKKPMKDEEELAHTLFNSFDGNQKKLAGINRPGQTYLPDRSESIKPFGATGISFSEMNNGQQQTLLKLLSAYINNMKKEIADQRLVEIKNAGLKNISFGFSGQSSSGGNHYYRIQGPTLIIEYDCRDGGDHIHAVWRDFSNDFGEDILRQHYKQFEH